MGRPVRQFETNGWLAVATLGLGCCLAATEFGALHGLVELRHAGIR